MTVVQRAGERFVTAHGGITSRHCFSAGPHYDPANVSFGPLVGVDEHVVEPGAGFDWHAHRGVQIASLVLSGELRHEDAGGSRCVTPGRLLVQSAGDGIRHREDNASGVEALRFVQVTVLGTGPVSVSLTQPPVRVGPMLIMRHAGPVRAPAVATPTFVFALRDYSDAAAGDSFRLADGESLALDGPGEALVLTLDALSETRQ